MFRLELFDHAVDSVALGRMQDAAVPKPERDVRRACFAALGVGDEITRAYVGFVDGRACVPLLVGISRASATGSPAPRTSSSRTQPG